MSFKTLKNRKLPLLMKTMLTSIKLDLKCKSRLKQVLKPTSSFPTGRSKAVPLLQLFVHLVSYMVFVLSLFVLPLLLLVPGENCASSLCFFFQGILTYMFKGLQVSLPTYLSFKNMY